MRKCTACQRQHSTKNKKNGKFASRCASCSAARRNLYERKKAAGVCIDCNEPSDTVRCYTCQKRMKDRLKKRGGCMNCGRVSDTASRWRCSRCVLRQFSKKKLGSPRHWMFLRDLLLAQKGRCAITGVEIRLGETASIDRIVPANRGGKRVRSNIRWVHLIANRMKNDMLDAEFLEWCRSVVTGLSAAKTVGSNETGPSAAPVSTAPKRKRSFPQNMLGMGGGFIAGPT